MISRVGLQRHVLTDHVAHRIVAELLRDRDQPHAVLGEPADVELELELVAEEPADAVHHDHIECPAGRETGILQQMGRLQALFQAMRSASGQSATGKQHTLCTVRLEGIGCAILASIAKFQNGLGVVTHRRCRRGPSEQAAQEVGMGRDRRRLLARHTGNRSQGPAPWKLARLRSH
jgi:hypothetical protein